MFDAEVIDGISEDGEGGIVVEVELVGDVPVNEDISGFACQEDTLRDAGVGATYPKDLNDRLLLTH